jgi:hypothetical protein
MLSMHAEAGQGLGRDQGFNWWGREGFDFAIGAQLEDCVDWSVR